ncbi:GlxA family transcriptional regulator [Hydrogenophaga palleronii]|uniref:GlxA family transcriptional regulator n=1 Tax=Hydrogenophaga palleronii TaxID=65655 RepID=UPI0008260400|nr:helix-turn-helix domain-containing protein [Hydrogenophaga palleronii]
MPAPKPFVIDIAVLPDSAPGHALALVELLRTANLLARLRLGARAPRMAWRFVQAGGQPLPAETGLLRGLAAEGDGGDTPASALFIPPLHLAEIPSIRETVRAQRALGQRVAHLVDTGGLVCTLGNAAWFAAFSGRLDHHRLALAWYYVAAIARDAPGLRPVAGQGFCEDGAWLSAAYPGDLGPLAIALTRRALGADAAQALAVVLQPDRERESAAAQASHAIPNTRDSTLARAIAWMEQHVEQPYDLAALATAAAVSPRTLLRHFRQELGHSPLDHLHALRCARARVLLEITLESVPTVAVACGYADPAAFRRIFVRHTGLTPSAYRERHALRAPRRRWRVDTGASADAALAALRLAAKRPGTA